MILLTILGVASEQTSIQGKVVIEAGKPAILRSQGKDVPLASDDKEISATFRDTRLSGREMKIVGKFRSDGSFEIHQFYMVRPDGLHRLIYFCHT